MTEYRQGGLAPLPVNLNSPDPLIMNTETSGGISQVFTRGRSGKSIARNPAGQRKSINTFKGKQNPTHEGSKE